MRRFWCLIIITVLSMASFAQTTVKELEHELSFHKAGEVWGGKKDMALRLLELDPLNREAIMYLAEYYHRLGTKDALMFFFNNLQVKNPCSTLPYLYRVEVADRFRIESLNAQINYLRDAYAIDSMDMTVVYYLGEKYYEAFHKGYADKKTQAALENAKKAIPYLEKYYRNNTFSDAVSWAALMQLYSYMKDQKKQTLIGNTFPKFYFPPLAFATTMTKDFKYVALPEGWDNDYSIDIIQAVESALFYENWYSLFLQAMGEPNLRDMKDGTAIRFTWLRTFHQPVVVRAENRKGSMVLHWKMTDGMGGYQTGKLSLSESRKLSFDEWLKLIGKIGFGNFWKLPATCSGMTGCDGAEWVLEVNNAGDYRVVNRWCGGEIKEMCLFLLKLTGRTIEDIY